MHLKTLLPLVLTVAAVAAVGAAAAAAAVAGTQSAPECRLLLLLLGRSVCVPDSAQQLLLLLLLALSSVCAKLQARHDAHRHQLLEQQLARIRHEHLQHT